MPNTTGTLLTCTNEECRCRILIEEPCPHGTTYRCACGYPFTEAGDFPLADAHR